MMTTIVKMKSSHEAKGKKKKSSSSNKDKVLLNRCDPILLVTDTGCFNNLQDSNSFREEDATGHRSAVLSRYADASSSASAAPSRPNSRWDSSNGHVEDNSAVSARADSEGSGEEQEGANAEADFDRMMRSQLVKVRRTPQCLYCAFLYLNLTISIYLLLLLRPCSNDRKNKIASPPTPAVAVGLQLGQSPHRRWTKRTAGRCWIRSVCRPLLTALIARAHCGPATTPTANSKRICSARAAL